MIYHFRDSVRSYLHDRMIGAGVDLLADTSSKLVPDLRWNELPSYYEAWLAAQRVKGDWALTLLELWEACWSDNVPAGWNAVDPDEQVPLNRNLNPHPNVCWEENWFGRLFLQGAERLWLCADMEDNVFRVGLWLEDKREKPLLTGNVPGMTYDRDAGILWQTDPPPYAPDGSLDVGETIGVCRAVRSFLEAR